MSETLTASTSATPAVAAPPLAPATAPLCYIVDEETSVRNFISLVLQGAGLDTMEFADGAALCRAIDRRLPDLVFHDVSVDAADAVNSMSELGKRGFRGAVQLTSSRGAAVLDHVKGAGSKAGLTMLPVLKKPYETEVIVRIVQELKLGTPLASAQIELEQALANDWIEFWYQPKIDLRRKQLAGAEAYARVRHPQHGVLLPGAFMPGAPDAAVVKLAELALASALGTGDTLSELGVNVPLSVNLRLAALSALPIADMVMAHGKSDKWPGLVIDVRESEVIAELPQAVDFTERLAPHKVRLAIDEFGEGHKALADFGEIPFAELKIDRKFIADIAFDKAHMRLCKSVIDLARDSKRGVVAMGIEKAADVTALMSLGCQYGQGFLLGEPMPAERFLSLLRRRTTTPARAGAAAAG